MRLMMIVNQTIVFQLVVNWSLFDSMVPAEPDDEGDVYNVQDGVSGPVTPRLRFGFVPNDLPEIDEDDIDDGGRVRHVHRVRAPRRSKLHMRDDLR